MKYENKINLAKAITLLTIVFHKPKRNDLCITNTQTTHDLLNTCSTIVHDRN